MMEGTGEKELFYCFGLTHPLIKRENMAHRIALITNSTCDIPSAWREQYEIGVVPLSIVFGSQSYLDGVELSAEQFYARLPVDASHPSTSQPTPEAFAAAYKQAA